MDHAKKKSRQYIAVIFIVLILYLIGNLYYNFQYIDLGYLIVIVIGFIRFICIRETD
jgi:hypothetical protein